jgi:histidinol-phosphate aminotransferase
MLDLIVKPFAPARSTLATPWPSYSLYPFYAALADLRLRKVPWRGAFRLDVEALTAEPASVTLVASPNNPTGHRTPRGELERVLAQSDGIVVVDEAYIEYAAPGSSLLPYVEDHDNLVVMRTFSKAYGLAGLRIGYLAANRELADRLRLVKPPFNLNLFAERVAIAALARQDFVEHVVDETVVGRDRLARELAGLGVRVHASEANFILFDVAGDPGAVAAGLRGRGVLVRTFPGAEGLEHAVRVTVGTPTENDAFLAALAATLAEAQA